MSSPGVAKTTLAAEAVNLCDDFPCDSVIFGCSPVMQRIRRTVEKVAATDVPVLIQGESGTGKEVLARLIHRLSPRSQGSFVKVSCAAIPGQLLESELFGFQKGAFTGAYMAKPGRIEMAKSGTLFLDEIAELDVGLQAKLLQVLQDGHFARIGDHEERKVDARVICATNRNLEKEIESGTFRRDLLYRINVISIHLPPLRDRLEDIPMLADHLVAMFSQRYGLTALPLIQEAKQELQRRDWPGNIRELENSMARYVLLGLEELLNFPPWEKRRSPAVSHELAPDGTMPLKNVVRESAQKMEREMVLKALAANKWNRRRTAEMLNISYRALLYKSRGAGPRSKRESQNGSAPSADPPD